MCINRTIVFMCDSIDFADCLTPHKEFPPRFPFFFSFFSFLSFLNGLLQDDLSRKRIFPPSLPPCPCMQINFARCDASLETCKPGKQGEGLSELHAASILSTANVSRDTFQNLQSRPPLFLFLSFSFSMERTTNALHCSITSCLEKRRMGIGMHPPG